MPPSVWWDERIARVSEVSLFCAEHHAQPVQLAASIDIDDLYVRSLVREAFERRPEWQVSCVRAQGETIAPEASCSDLHWGEYERIDWERVHDGDQVASCYCVRKGLIRKAHLAHNLRKWTAKHPGDRLNRAVPETLIMVLDDIEYFEEALSDVFEVRDMLPGADIWIAKPSLTNQGVGLCLFDRVAGLRVALEAAPDLREWVLQRYIRDPLLVGGRKFHLRAYVLCVGSLRCFVFSEMLALFAGEPYSAGLDNLQNMAAHLTNTCYHIEAGTASLPEEEIVRLASELPEVLSREGMPRGEAEARVAALHRDVRDIIAGCMDAVSAELTFFTLPNCFELFGFDLLADERWNVWLLEANAEPDMSQTGERLRGVIGDLVEGVLQLVADPLAAAKANGADCGGAGDACATPPAGHGRWVEVLNKPQRDGSAGGSGMRML